MDTIAKTIGLPTGVSLGLLVVVYFARFINSNLQAPLLVELAQEFHTSVAAVGQIAVAISMPWGLSGPLIGPLSDRYGRKPVMVAGLGLLCLSGLLTAFAWDYPSLLAFRFLAGVGGAATAPTAIAIIGDELAPERRGRALGVLFGGEAMGALVGLPLATVLAGELGWRTAFVVMGGSYGLLALAFWLAAPGRRPLAKSSGYWRSIRQALGTAPTSWVLTANGLVQTSFFVVATFLPAYLMVTYGLSVSAIAPALVVLALGNLVGALAGGPLADRYDRYLSYAGLTLAAGLLAVGLMLAAPGLWPAVLLGAGFHALHAAGRPVYTCIVTGVSAPLRGTVLGLNATSNHLGTSAGSAAGGLVLGWLGYPALGAVSLLVSVASAAGFWLLGTMERGKRTP